MQSIVLGGGCFWCLEASYQLIHGIESVVSGYSGGHDPNPTYDAVCSGITGHAEVVEVIFDESVVSLEKILAIFWIIHDPTTLNRQGADVGSQYRSTIFYTKEGQKEIIDASITQAQTLLSQPIVTEVAKLNTFYAAEDYHQNYFANHPEQAYCQIIIDPKLKKLRQHFDDTLRH